MHLRGQHAGQLGGETRPVLAECWKAWEDTMLTDTKRIPLQIRRLLSQFDLSSMRYKEELIQKQCCSVNRVPHHTTPIHTQKQNGNHAAKMTLELVDVVRVVVA